MRTENILSAKGEVRKITTKKVNLLDRIEAFSQNRNQIYISMLLIQGKANYKEEYKFLTISSKELVECIRV